MSDPKTKELLDIVQHQASLQSLWLMEPTIVEALLQAALRHLHAIIEDDLVAAKRAKDFYWNVEAEL